MEILSDMIFMLRQIFVQNFRQRRRIVDLLSKSIVKESLSVKQRQEDVLDTHLQISQHNLTLLRKMVAEESSSIRRNQMDNAERLNAHIQAAEQNLAQITMREIAALKSLITASAEKNDIHLDVHQTVSLD